MLKVFWSLWKQIVFGFMKNIWRVTKKAVSNTYSIVLPNGNFLEQEFQNFNRNEVGNEDPAGGDNNVEEKI